MSLHHIQVILVEELFEIGLVDDHKGYIGFFSGYLFIKVAFGCLIPMCIKDGLQSSGKVSLTRARFTVKEYAPVLLIRIDEHYLDQGIDGFVIL